MTTTEVVWRVNVWRDGAWAPYYGESSTRVSGRQDLGAAEKNVRRSMETVARRGDVARLSCRRIVIEHRNLDTLSPVECQEAFADSRIRGAAFPCAACGTLTTFVSSPMGGSWRDMRLCGYSLCLGTRSDQGWTCPNCWHVDPDPRGRACKRCKKRGDWIQPSEKFEIKQEGVGQ